MPGVPSKAPDTGITVEYITVNLNNSLIIVLKYYYLKVLKGQYTIVCFVDEL
jgi:hypothetical protein